MTVAAIILASIEWNPPRKPFLGIAIPQGRNPYGSGVFVTNIRPDFAAAKVGVKASDRIVALNYVTVGDSYVLLAKVRKIKIGEPCTLTVERDGALTVLGPFPMDSAPVKND